MLTTSFLWFHFFTRSSPSPKYINILIDIFYQSICWSLSCYKQPSLIALPSIPTKSNAKPISIVSGRVLPAGQRVLSPFPRESSTGGGIKPEGLNPLPLLLLIQPLLLLLLLLLQQKSLQSQVATVVVVEVEGSAIILGLLSLDLPLLLGYWFWQ